MKRRIRLTESNLRQIVTECINEMAIRQNTIDQWRPVVEALAQEYRDLSREYGSDSLLDLSDPVTRDDERYVTVNVPPKMYKNGMVVMKIDGEVYKGTFDKKKLEDPWKYPDLESAKKLLMWFKKMLEWTKKEYQDYDPEWDDEPHGREKFIRSIRKLNGLRLR